MARRSSPALRRRRDRVQRQLANKACDALVLDRVEDDQEEHGDRHTKRHIDVGRRHHLHVRNTAASGRERNPVNRDQIHEVHQEHPDENRQAKRRDQSTLAVEGVFDAAVDKLDDDLNQGLKLVGLARRRLLRCAPEQNDETRHQAAPTRTLSRR